ncbi:MAG: hypothetical protein JST16_00175 [Bdellovibrionales bacterium]|nr:hypothetical protein [Bdellovibrionales bacterium]
MKTDWSKKYLREAEVSAADEAGATRVLEALRQHPAAFGRQDPPLGYENDLLAALRRQLPLEQKVTASQAAPRRSRSFLQSPAFAWAMSGCFALAAITTIFNFRDAGPANSMDLMAEMARKGDSAAVDSWAASMSDSSVQRRVAMADIDSAARGLSARSDRHLIDKILGDVARNMGMQ